MRTRLTISSNMLAGVALAAVSMISLDAHAELFTHGTGANQIAGSVHVPGNSNDIYVSTAAGFKIRARFGMGSRTVGASNVNFGFDLTEIRGGESYEVLVDVVELSTSGTGTGGTGTGGMGPAPGPGTGGTTGGCMGTMSLPWSFSRSRTDSALPGGTTVFGPWTGYMPIPTMFNYIINHVPGSCPPARASAIQSHLMMNRSAVETAMQAYINADIYEHTFDAGFALTGNEQGRQHLLQLVNGALGDVQMSQSGWNAEADAMENEALFIMQMMEDVPCDAPPNEVAEDQCAAHDDRLDHIHEEIQDLRNRVAAIEQDKQKLREQNERLQQVMINNEYAFLACGVTGDVVRSALVTLAALKSANIARYAIALNAVVGAACTIANLRAHAMNPNPAAAERVKAGMLRNAANYGIDTITLVAATVIEVKKCAALGPGASACVSTACLASYDAWFAAGVIYIGGPLLINAAIEKFWPAPVFGGG
jgi:hypothetical protein